MFCVLYAAVEAAIAFLYWYCLSRVNNSIISRVRRGSPEKSLLTFRSKQSHNCWKSWDLPAGCSVMITWRSSSPSPGIWQPSTGVKAMGVLRVTALCTSNCSTRDSLLVRVTTTGQDKAVFCHLPAVSTDVFLFQSPEK